MFACILTGADCFTFLSAVLLIISFSEGVVRELKSRGVIYKSRDTAVKTWPGLFSVHTIWWASSELQHAEAPRLWCTMKLLTFLYFCCDYHRLQDGGKMVFLWVIVEKNKAHFYKKCECFGCLMCLCSANSERSETIKDQYSPFCYTNWKVCNSASDYAVSQNIFLKIAAFSAWCSKANQTAAWHST